MTHKIFDNIIMKFLEYTKKLYEKVAYYDNVAKRFNMSNPFTKPKKITTIIWIEDKNSES